MTAAAAAAAFLVLAAGCTVTPSPEQRTSPSPSPSSSPTGPEADPGPLTLRFAVYGEQPQLAAYERLAKAFMRENSNVTVEVLGAPTPEEADRRLEEWFDAGFAPDVFLLEQEWLPRYLVEERVQPVNDVLAQRGVDFGDGYQRDGLVAFSADDALQCMPHDVSPLVVYYNPDLVDMSRVGEPGEEPVTAEDGWTFEQFRLAAAQAAGDGAEGLHIEPSLMQLAPFIWSAGGEVVDDLDDPTSLTLSDGDARAALEVVLDTVREPRLTPGVEQLAEQDALTRFERGDLGMILGTHELVPRLQAADGLDFEVFPLPRIGSYRTSTDMSGYCLSATSEHAAAAADFLAFAVSNEGATITTEPGYVQPSNLQVAHSPAFIQPGMQPENVFVFNEGVRRSERLPRTVTWPIVEAATVPYLRRMFYDPVIDLETLLEEADQRSQVILAPEEE